MAKWGKQHYEDTVMNFVAKLNSNVKKIGCIFLVVLTYLKWGKYHLKCSQNRKSSWQISIFFIRPTFKWAPSETLIYVQWRIQGKGRSGSWIPPHSDFNFNRKNGKSSAAPFYGNYFKWAPSKSLIYAQWRIQGKWGSGGWIPPHPPDFNFNQILI